ncbi:hypothetical protein [Vibrio coralliilyticus]|uniref:hypothetical protein n=1 Tax=Vibrio coralliilyticus TaxID=190893 RepID=UPI001186B968
MYRLEDGQMVPKGTLSFDRDSLIELGISNVIAVREYASTFLINQDSDRAVSGTYLVDLDGLLSLNEIQRLL